MSYLDKFCDFTTEARQSFKETIAAIRWAPTMYSRKGMRYIYIAAGCMLLANAVELVGPYFIGQLAAAHAGMEVNTFNQLLGALALVWIGGTTIERYGNNRREKGWSFNDRAMRINLTREWYKKTPQEILSEDRDVGANQIESGANSLERLQHATYFSGISIVATVFVLTSFLIITDARAGLAISGVLIVNLIVIFYINHAIHKEMKVVGKKMRAIHNQLIEYWKQHTYIVATGNERTVIDWLTDAMKEPWHRDYIAWGVWYAIVDGIRSSLTAIALVYIIYQYSWEWNTATFVSILGWLLIYREQFGQIAQTQRQLTREIEKVHALETEFRKEPNFDQGAFTQEGA